MLLGVAYYSILLHTYATYISPVYSYAGLSYRPLSWQPIAYGVFLTAWTAFWLPPGLGRPSHVCLYVFYVFLIVPVTFVPFCVGLGTALFPLVIAIQFCLLQVIVSLPPIDLPQPRTFDPYYLQTFLIVSCFVLIGLLLLVGGSLTFSLDLSEVYDRRLESREITGNSTARAYAISLLTSCVALLLCSIGLANKNLVLFLVGSLGYFTMFFFSGAKGAAFTPFVLMLFWLTITHCGHTFGRAVLVSMVLLVGLGMLEATMLDSSNLNALIIRRKSIIPAYLTSCYWDFFTQNSYTYYTDSVLRWFVHPVYDLPKPRLIGLYYAENIETNANANIWATAFGNAGYLGVFATTIMVGFLLRMIDGLAERIGLPLMALVVLSFALKWGESGFETSLVTHGVAPTLLFLIFYRPTKQQDSLSSNPTSRPLSDGDTS